MRKKIHENIQMQIARKKFLNIEYETNAFILIQLYSIQLYIHYSVDLCVVKTIDVTQ